MNRILITGASSGIGLATAQLLAEQGKPLVLLARRLDRLQNFKNKFPSTVVAAVDLQNPKAIAEFAKNHEPLLADVDTLINNAGLAAGMESFQDCDLNDVDAMIATNVTGLLHLTRKLLPFMVKKQSGHIVNLGSVAGRLVYPKGTVYCATKFAVRAISDGLRMDLAGTNIRVTNIEPGMVETEFSEVRLKSKEKAQSVYQNMTPLSATDIAESIMWCLNRPKHVNIQELVIYPTDQASVGQVVRNKKS